MNGPIPWILISVLVLLILGVVMVIALKKKDYKSKPDYRAFFYLGLVFLFVYAIGDLFGRNEPSSIFLILSIVYLTMGLAHKDKWGKEKKWSELSQSEKAIKIILITVAAFLVVAGIITFFLVK